MSKTPSKPHALPLSTRPGWQAPDPGASQRAAAEFQEQKKAQIRDFAKKLLVPLYAYLDAQGMPVVERHELWTQSMETLADELDQAQRKHLIVEDQLEDEIERIAASSSPEAAAHG